MVVKEDYLLYLKEMKKNFLKHLIKNPVLIIIIIVVNLKYLKNNKL